MVQGQWHRNIFGLAGNAAVGGLVEPVADEVRVRRARHRRLPCAATARPAMEPGLGAGTTGRGSHRGNHARPGYTLRCDKYRRRQRPVAL